MKKTGMDKVRRFAELTAQSKELSAELKNLRDDMLTLVGPGERVETAHGFVCHEQAESIITDGLIDKLKKRGVWAKVRKSTIDTPKLRALAKIDAAVKRLIKTETVARIAVKAK